MLKNLFDQRSYNNYYPTEGSLDGISHETFKVHKLQIFEASQRH